MNDERGQNRGVLDSHPVLSSVSMTCFRSTLRVGLLDLIEAFIGPLRIFLLLH